MIPAVTRIDAAAQRNSVLSIANSTSRLACTFICDRFRQSPRQALLERGPVVAVGSVVHRAGLPVRQAFSDQLVFAVCQRDIIDLTHQSVAFGEIEVEEATDFWPVERLYPRVDEDGSGKRGVRAVLHGFR